MQSFLHTFAQFLRNCAWSLSSALGDREYFVLSSPSLAVSSSITTNEFRSRIFHFIFNEMKCSAYSRAERSSPADGVSSCKQSLIFACRLNYPAKLHAATACRFCVRPAHRCKNFAGGFVGGGIVCLVFQLYNIVDYLLIHRPYGFIVQFLMINTGNGGSFVQL